jgi:hypothetical protein
MSTDQHHTTAMESTQLQTEITTKDRYTISQSISSSTYGKSPNPENTTLMMSTESFTTLATAGYAMTTNSYNSSLLRSTESTSHPLMHKQHRYYLTHQILK